MNCGLSPFSHKHRPRARLWKGCQKEMGHVLPLILKIFQPSVLTWISPGSSRAEVQYHILPLDVTARHINRIAHCQNPNNDSQITHSCHLLSIFSVPDTVTRCFQYISFWSYTNSAASGSVISVLELEMSPRSHLSRAGIWMRFSKSKAHVLPLAPHLEIIHEPPYFLCPSAPCHSIAEKYRMGEEVICPGSHR